MNDIASILPLVAATTAAVIAALASFLMTVLSKDQRTSEFRQAWIDALRNDIAEFDSHVGAFLSVLADGRDWDKPTLIELFDKRYHELRNIESLHIRIRLRLNPSEHAELLRRLNACRGVLGPEIQLSISDYNELSNGLVEETQKVLKREWSRVKRGELTFVLVKRTALVIVVLGAIASGYLAIR